MTVKGVGGKPRKFNADGTRYIAPEVSTEENFEPDMYEKPRTIQPKEVKIMSNKIGSFIVVNTMGLQGLRINVQRISSYSPNSDRSIGIAWDNSTLGTTLKFNTPEEMFKVLEQMDSVCL